MLVGEDDQVARLSAGGRRTRCRGPPGTCGPCGPASTRPDQRLDGEQVDLDLVVVVHRRAHRRRGEVLGRDHDRLEAHRSEQALAVTGREVVLGLVQDRAARSDDHEVAHAVSGDEQLHRPGQDVGLADASGRVDDGLERRLGARRRRSAGRPRRPASALLRGSALAGRAGRRSRRRCPVEVKVAHQFSRRRRPIACPGRAVSRPHCGSDPVARPGSSATLTWCEHFEGTCVRVDPGPADDYSLVLGERRGKKVDDALVHDAVDDGQPPPLAQRTAARARTRSPAVLPWLRPDHHSSCHRQGTPALIGLEHGRGHPRTRKTPRPPRLSCSRLSPRRGARLSGT